MCQRFSEGLEELQGIQRENVNLFIQSHDSHDSREKPQEEPSPSQGPSGDKTTAPSSGLGFPDASFSETSALCHFTL